MKCFQPMKLSHLRFENMSMKNLCLIEISFSMGFVVNKYYLNMFLIKQYLYNNEDDSNELYDAYKEISLKPIEYINLNKQRYIGYFLMLLSLVISILISLICSLTVYEDCLYATITVLGLLPSILLSLGITKALNFKKNWFALLIFIPVFYLLTYLMTIFFRDCSFIESFEVHFKHIISAVPDILDSITKNSDIEWGEKE